MPRHIDAGSDGFPTSDRNRLRRLHERGRYDRASIYPVVDAAIVRPGTRGQARRRSRMGRHVAGNLFRSVNPQWVPGPHDLK